MMMATLGEDMVQASTETTESDLVTGGGIRLGLGCCVGEIAIPAAVLENWNV